MEMKDKTPSKNAIKDKFEIKIRFLKSIFSSCGFKDVILETFLINH